MARLTLKLLGGFLLRADDRPRALPARKAQALLAYLAVRAGRAHARETLTALLWGDVGERQARQSLRQTMVRLRRVLAANPRALLAQGDTVTLTPAALDLDVSHSSGSCGVEPRRRSSRPWRSTRVRCSTACTSRRRPSRSGSR
jgi:DNA-binding SARP family transcriptional activator